MINLIFADKPEARHLGQVGVFKMCNSLLISFALFGLILVLKLFPDTSVGTWLNKVLVDVPASWLLKVTAWKIVALGITIIGVLALVPAMPFYIALMTIGDATAYFEVFVATSTIAVTISWKSLLRSANRLAATLTANISPVVRRCGFVIARTAQRALRIPPSRSKGNSDDDGWPFSTVAS